MTEQISNLLERKGCDITTGPDLQKVVTLLKERVHTITELADKTASFFIRLEPPEEAKKQYFSAEIKPVMCQLIAQFSLISSQWNRQSIHDVIKKTATVNNMKLPKIAMPLRVMVTGETQTPSIDIVLELLGSMETIDRMNRQITNFPA